MSRVAAATIALVAACVVLAPSARAGGEEEPEYSAELPAEVLAFIERVEGCLHWTGEEPYDEARQREIEAAVEELRCSALKADHAKLRRRYANSKALEALDELPMDQF
jgi:hypothetical protein